MGRKRQKDAQREKIVENILSFFFVEVLVERFKLFVIAQSERKKKQQSEEKTSLSFFHPRCAPPLSPSASSPSQVRPEATGFRFLKNVGEEDRERKKELSFLRRFFVFPMSTS